MDKRLQTSLVKLAKADKVIAEAFKSRSMVNVYESLTKHQDIRFRLESIDDQELDELAAKIADQLETELDPANAEIIDKVEEGIEDAGFGDDPDGGASDGAVIDTADEPEKIGDIVESEDVTVPVNYDDAENGSVSTIVEDESLLDEVIPEPTAESDDLDEIDTADGAAKPLFETDEEDEKDADEVKTEAADDDEDEKKDDEDEKKGDEDKKESFGFSISKGRMKAIRESVGDDAAFEKAITFAVKEAATKLAVKREAAKPDMKKFTKLLVEAALASGFVPSAESIRQITALKTEVATLKRQTFIDKAFLMKEAALAKVDPAKRLMAARQISAIDFKTLREFATAVDKVVDRHRAVSPKTESFINQFKAVPNAAAPKAEPKALAESFDGIKI